MEKVITIEHILPKKSSKGQSYWVLRSEGEGYFVWDKEKLTGLQIGDTIKIEYEEGRYPRVSAILPQRVLPVSPAMSKPQAVPAFPVEVKAKGQGLQGKTKDERIEVMHDENMRAVALQTAINYVCGLIAIDKLEKKADTIDTILKVAETFEKWLKR